MKEGLRNMFGAVALFVSTQGEPFIDVSATCKQVDGSGFRPVIRIDNLSEFPEDSKVAYILPQSRRSLILDREVAMTFPIIASAQTRYDIKIYNPNGFAVATASLETPRCDLPVV